jgi:hypothetical protein
MVERFEENLGRIKYVTLIQVKDYLSISSNTQDARLSNIISYATGVVEHYIGQEVLANDYVEIFDGGISSVFTSRLPLSNVYQVSEFNGIENIILSDPTTIGTPVVSTNKSISFTAIGDAKNTTKVKMFGKSSLELDENSYITSPLVPEQLQFDQSDFTIEMFVKVDDAFIRDNVLFEISTDSANYMRFSLANQYGLSFSANVSGSETTILGANSAIESQYFQKKRWAHVSVSRDYVNERLYLAYNGTIIANTTFTDDQLSFTNSVSIGNTFKGYIDEVRVSNKARYITDFTVPTFRFRPDNDTVLLVHFDEKHKSTQFKDVHSKPADYNFARDTGEITKDTGSLGVTGNFSSTRRSYPALTMNGPQTFQPFPSAIEVTYRAGYEAPYVPLDLQVATLDYIKLLYKQDQEKKGFSFEGERGDQFPLAGNFPPHIRRILDLYRIID